MNVLVTGGHGFLGSHLVEALKSRGEIDLYAPTRKECDLRNPEVVRNLFQKREYDLVFHLAASVGGIGANQESPADFFYDNALMGLHLIHEATKAKVGRLILLGTICSYPKFAKIPFHEEDLWNGYPEETNAPYGVAKRSLLVAAQAYKQQYGLKYTALFPTNLYGPGDDFDLNTSHVIPAMIRKYEEAKSKKLPSIELWGTGKPTRDFLYVTDAVAGLMLSAEKEEAEGEAMNLGSEREVSIRELAEIISEATGYQGDIRWDTSRPDGQPRRCVSSERAKKLLGFSPKVSLEEGVQKTVHWYREHFRKS